MIRLKFMRNSKTVPVIVSYTQRRKQTVFYLFVNI